MLPLINMFWFGDRLPALHRMCIASFVQQGHPVDLYCYESLDGVPAHVRLKDANEVVSRACHFRSTSGSYALFGDQFRYELLHRIGGWWSDCDVFCLRPFNLKAEYVFGRETPTRINNAVLKLPAQCELTQRLVDDGRQLGTHRRWTKGAWVFHDAVMDLGLDAFAVPQKVFYSVPANEWHTVFEPGQAPKLPQSPHGLHLWAEMIRRHQPHLQKGPFHRDSLAGELWQRLFGESTSIKDGACNTPFTC